MKNTIEIQKEFEALVEELERLKTINELTSTNTENAKKIISGVDTFLKQLHLFESTIASDFEEKKLSLENLMRSLNDLKSGVDKSFQNNFKNLQDEIVSFKSNIEKLIENTKSSLKSITNTITAHSESLSEGQQNTERTINDFKISINENLKLSLNSITSAITKYSEDLSEAKKITEDTLSKFEISISENIKTNKNALTSTITSHSASIEAKQSITEEKMKASIQEVNTQLADYKKANKLRFYIGIGIFIICWILLMLK